MTRRGPETFFLEHSGYKRVPMWTYGYQPPIKHVRPRRPPSPRNNACRHIARYLRTVFAFGIGLAFYHKTTLRLFYIPPLGDNKCRDMRVELFVFHPCHPSRAISYWTINNQAVDSLIISRLSEQLE